MTTAPLRRSPVAMPGRRRVYWLASPVTRAHSERARRLGERGFEVEFFTSLVTLMSDTELKRPIIMVVDSVIQGQPITDAISKLTAVADIQGAKFVLSATHGDQKGFPLAAGSNFRDIIPFQVDDNQWLQRFLYATSSKASPWSLPTPQVTMANIAALHFPGRLVWLGGKRLRIECRLSPPVGASLQLTGEFARRLGRPSVSIIVEDVQRSMMDYRFSEAIVASWHLPTPYADAATRFLTSLKEEDTGRRARVFMAVQDPVMRSAITERLPPKSFDLAIAMSKQGLAAEPRFFTPDVVIIDGALMTDGGGERFKEMLTALAPDVPIIALGKKPHLQQMIADAPRDRPDRRIVGMEKVPNNLPEALLAKKLLSDPLKTYADRDAAYIAATSTLSHCQLSVPVRITRLHPRAAQIALPFMPSRFALTRLESPLLKRVLGKDPYIKITDVFGDGSASMNSSFPYRADAYMADASTADQGRIARAIQELIRASFAKTLGGDAAQMVSQTSQSAAHEVTAPRQSAPGTDASGWAPLGSPIARPASVSDARPAWVKDSKTTDRYAPKSHSDKTVVGGAYRSTESSARSTSSQSPTSAARKEWSEKDTQRVLGKVLGALAIIGVVWLCWHLLQKSEAWRTSEDLRSGERYTDFFRQFAPEKFDRPPVQPASEPTP